MNIICSNCGKANHLQRDCKEPLTSYGLICFHKFKLTEENEEYKIILIRRKDTIGYVEFLRGKYNINNTDYIIKLFDMMTNEEKERIKNVWDFDKLRIILKMTKKNNVYKNEYELAKKKFNHLKNKRIMFKNSKNVISILNYLINKSKISWNETEWGLPKGRKNKNETNINCAVREFLEETGINKDNIRIILNIKPINEIYTSINNVTYRHIYFFAEYINENTTIMVNPNDVEQSIEISSINWFNKQVSSSIIRDYYIQKKKIINKSFSIINEMVNYGYLND